MHAIHAGAVAIPLDLFQPPSQLHLYVQLVHKLDITHLVYMHGLLFITSDTAKTIGYLYKCLQSRNMVVLFDGFYCILFTINSMNQIIDDNTMSSPDADVSDILYIAKRNQQRFR